MVGIHYAIPKILNQEHNRNMEYHVGDRVDLTYLNPPQATQKKSVSRPVSKYLDGTKIRFLQMKEIIVLDITEPPVALSVSFSV